MFARQVRTELAALIVAHRYGGPLAAAAEALLELGLLDSADGQRATASRRIRHAIRLYRRVGDHAGETDATAALAAIITRKDS